MTSPRPGAAPTAAVLATLAALVILGGLLAWHKSAFTFGLGDQALFHAFGRWILDGEVYIRDFIHFRTPGPYYFYAALQGLLGSEFRTTSFALVLEAQVAQTAAGFLLGWAATRAVWGRGSLAVAAVCGVAFLVLPPIFQLRTALPAVALAAYLLALTAATPVLERRWLMAVGALLGLGYWFGQELFVFLSWTLFCVEVGVRRDRPAAIVTRLLILAASGLAIILVPLALLAAAGMNVGDYLYYTFIYAFFIQPTGMDLPFPPLSWQTLVFYVVFVQLAAAAAIFALAGRLGQPVVVALLAFASIRMISALGRSDVLHLVFSVSEAVVVLPLMLLVLREVRLSGRWRLAVAAGGGLALVFAVGVLMSSKALLLAPVVLALLGRFGPWLIGAMPATASTPVTPPRPMGALVAAVVSLILVLVAFHPYPERTIRFGVSAMRTAPVDPLQGVQLQPLVRTELAGIAGHVARLNADSLFSFPIRPDLHALAPHHPTRLTFFEPQTTAAEYAAVFAELQAAPPPLAVQDLVQTAALSPFVYPLADFIGSHYAVTASVRGASVLEVLTPRPRPVAQRRLFDRLYLGNPERDPVIGFAFAASAVDGPEEPVLHVRRAARFPFEPGPERALVLGLEADAAGAAAARLTLSRDGITAEHWLDAGTGPLILPLPDGTGPLEVVLYPGDDGRPGLWRNPILTTAPEALQTAVRR